MFNLPKTKTKQSYKDITKGLFKLYCFYSVFISFLFQFFLMTRMFLSFFLSFFLSLTYRRVDFLTLSLYFCLLFFLYLNVCVVSTHTVISLSLMTFPDRGCSMIHKFDYLSFCIRPFNRSFIFSTIFAFLFVIPTIIV